MKNSTKVIDRSVVKHYFIGKSQRGPVLLMLVGIPFIFMMGIGIIMIVAGAVWYYMNKNDFTGEGKVDEIVEYELDQMKEKALEKLNLVEEEVNIIEPVTVSGPADQPVTSTSVQLANTNNGILGLLMNAKKAVLENSDDPVYMVKVGSDNKVRYTLHNMTTYLFGEHQLFIYYCNVDITTGIVFEEGTLEYFYEDITSISTCEIKQKIHTMISKKKSQDYRIVKERMSIANSGGSSFSAGLGAREESAPSQIGDRFVAMRNLIREKKTNKR